MRDPQTGATTADRKSGGITQVDYDSNYGAPCLNNALDAQEFDTVTHRVFWRIPSTGVTANMARTTVLLDQNGSLSPTSGAFQYLMPQTAFLVHGKSPASLSGSNLYSLSTSVSSYGQLILKLGGDSNGLNPAGPTKVDLGWWHAQWTPQSDPQDVVRLNRADPSTDLAAFPTNTLINEANVPGSSAQVILLDYYFTSSPGDFPDELDLTFQYAEALNQYCILGIPYDHQPIINHNCNGQAISGGLGTLSDIRSFVPNAGQKHDWRFDSGSNMLWIWTTAVLDTSANAYPEGTHAQWLFK